MHISTRNRSMACALCVVTVAMACFSTGQVYAQEPPTEPSQSSITIVNNLEQPLVFGEIKNRQAIQIKSDPPAEILPHKSGQFKIEKGTSMKNVHLNIKYAIKDTADQVGVVYKLETAGMPHCPKEHPDWVTETAAHCGNWSSGWTYTFAPK